MERKIVLSLTQKISFFVFCCFFFHLSNAQTPQFASIRPDLPCGSDKAIPAVGLNYCTKFLGVPMDAYYFENLNITGPSIASLEGWVKNLVDAFQPKEGSCYNCLEWYKIYLCIAGLPGQRYSQCFIQKFWKTLRNNVYCRGACVENATAPCNPNLQCCVCLNITSPNCNSGQNLVAVSDDEDYACGPVPYNICLQTFSTCLGSDFNPKICDYWTPTNNPRIQLNNAVNPSPTILPSSNVCSGQFRAAITSGVLQGTSGFPILQNKGCNPVWVTQTVTEKQCYTATNGTTICSDVSTDGKKVLTCGTSKTLLSFTFLLLAAVLFLFF
eukprot:TRINITY_DN2176_c0_g1_i1.p1 TRINITY_DN2176_c0_g1~~TRINITY_DN2176_c0_g1_i1.p1  ORF type:complete len:348 (+),score=110.75 TRINITY_DN2176_c0_g1_i1:64-1044(+)